MIKKLHMQNFKSHKDTTIEFDPGINVITGLSDGGKSNVIRSIDWITNNHPAGNGYQSHWKGTSISTLYLDDDITVSRKRTDKENLYTLNKEEHKAFGQDVPEDVKNAINFTNINIQLQLDPHFLISQNSGDIAKYFNKIVNLEIIDESTTRARSAIKKVKDKKDFNTKELEQTDTQIAELAWVDAAWVEFEQVEQFAAGIEIEKNKWNSLSSLFGKYNRLQAEKINIDIDAASKALDKIIELEAAFIAQVDVKNELENLFLDYRALQKEKVDIDIDTALTEYAALSVTLEKFTLAVDNYENLVKQAAQIQEVEKLIARETEKAAQLKQKLEEIMPEICPVCERPI